MKKSILTLMIGIFCLLMISLFCVNMVSAADTKRDIYDYQGSNLRTKVNYSLFDAENFTGTRINTSDATFRVVNITGFNSGDVLNNEFDLQIGTNGHGAIRLGSSQIFDSNLTPGGMDINGSLVFRNVLASSNFQFLFATTDGNINFIIPRPGPQFATYNPRSFMIGGDLGNSYNSNLINCTAQGYDNIDCSTDITGADLGIQDDLEVRGTIYGDENITISDTFKGLFNWVISLSDSSSRYFSFNGTTLNFSEINLNSTIDNRIEVSQAVFVPVTLNVGFGVTDAGNLASVQTINDGDSLNISEVSGTPGFQIVMNYTDIPVFANIQLHEFYDGSLAHTVNVELYNFGTTQYDVIGAIGEGETDFMIENFPIADSDPYISETNTSLRINHVSAGNPTHNYFLDYSALQRIAQPTRDHGSMTGLIDDDHLQYLKTITNIFDQDLNTTNNVQFANITSTGNLTIIGNASFIGGVVLNKDGLADSDIRIKSATDDSAFFFESSTGRIGFGTDDPASFFNVLKDLPGSTLEYIIENNATANSASDSVLRLITDVSGGDTFVSYESVGEGDNFFVGRDNSDNTFDFDTTSDFSSPILSLTNKDVTFGRDIFIIRDVNITADLFVGDDLFVIDQVGIGTASPGAKLDVTGGGAIIDDDTAIGRGIIAGVRLAIQEGTSQTTDMFRMIQASTGDVSMGFVKSLGVDYILGLDASDNGNFGISEGLNLGVNRRFTIQNATGFIGIGGITSPTHELNVDGDVNITGDLFVQDNLFVFDQIEGGTVNTPRQLKTLDFSDTTFALTSNVIVLTGIAGGQSITTITGGKSGQLLTIIFTDGLVTLIDNNGHGSNTLDLTGDITGADDAVIQLIFDGVSWYQVSAVSVN